MALGCLGAIDRARQKPAYESRNGGAERLRVCLFLFFFSFLLRPAPSTSTGDTILQIFICYVLAFPTKDQ